MFEWLRRRTEKLFGGNPRSSKWPRVREDFLRRNPCCLACGRAKNLEVHHIRPFHLNPELELDPRNLVPLCAEPCHLVHGHLMSWVRHNPDVVEHCNRYRAALEKAKTPLAA